LQPLEKENGKMKKGFLAKLAAAIATSAIVLTGCAQLGIPNSGSDSQTTGATMGRLEVRVTDAPPEKKVTAVNVTVASVEINKNGSENGENGWQSLALTGATTFDLLKVQGLEQLLATSELAPGTYGQIRMDVTKVMVTYEGSQPVEAKLPSGKLKFIQGFEIAAGKTTVLLFDFDAAKSIHTAGNSGQVIFQPVIKINATFAPGALGITTVSLPNGMVGVPYTATVAAMGGQTPYTWSITGTLPAGLTLNPATGVVSGTPTAAGDATFTVKVDSFAIKKTAEKSFIVSIAAADGIQIVNTSLADGTAGSAYTATLTALGGTAPLAWTLAAGSVLPTGLTLSAAGVISGTPAAGGNFTFTVTVTDATTPTAKTDSQALTLKIVAAPALQITTTTLANGTLNTPYTATVAATGGIAPLTFSLTAGTLPVGLALNATTGVISGTPTAAGDSSFTVTVTDSATPTHLTYAQPLTLHIA
jgi:hypothetical protein